jgi:DNA-binding transcriptional regulator GbsR (MarR family)
MVRTVWVKGDRKDYYEAETDFWKIVKGGCSGEEEFDSLDSVSKLLQKSAARESLLPFPGGIC